MGRGRVLCIFEFGGTTASPMVRLRIGLIPGRRGRPIPSPVWRWGPLIERGGRAGRGGRCVAVGGLTARGLDSPAPKAPGKKVFRPRITLINVLCWFTAFVFLVSRFQPPDLNTQPHVQPPCIGGGGWGTGCPPPPLPLAPPIITMAPTCSRPIGDNALCPRTVSPMSLPWLPKGITVTYIRSNGDQPPSSPLLSMYVSIE